MLDERSCASRPERRNSFTCDIALPRGTHQPIILSNVSWHSFDLATFLIGHEHADAGEGAKLRSTPQGEPIVDTF